MKQRLSDRTPAPTDGCLRVLLVEHNEADANLLLNFMNKGDQGVEVVWVSSFIDAMSELRRNNYDAMLLDLLLPDSHGIDAIRRVSDRADIPVIALTKEAEHPPGVDALLAGADASS